MIGCVGRNFAVHVAVAGMFLVAVGAADVVGFVGIAGVPVAVE
jgi:hypothetical protein